jgi:beta-lactamase regulating signal transducer with metallopeptidase domain/Tol biopolymer transport system component
VTLGATKGETMEPFEANLATFLQWLLKATLQGSLLICLILLIKVILRERLPARWHYCLWLVLLLRLTLPWAPQSRISVYGLIPRPFSSHDATSGFAVPPPSEARARPDAIVRGSSAARTSAAGQAGISQPGQGGTAQPSAMQPPGKTPVSSNEQPSQASGQDHRLASFVARVLACVWLAGGVALAGYILVRAFALWRAVASERPVTEQPVLELLEDCKMQMRVRTLVGVVVTDKVQTPALFGVIRPRILLPQGLIETLGLDELHCIFLHELAHLKRRDICLAWLVCLLQVLHWFNPLIWFALRRMRADQEMAADALALSAAGTDESRLYGQTIVNLLERFSRPQYLPSLAGILENPSHIERRIQMIAKFNRTPRRPLLAMVLLAVLGLITLTEAQNKSEGGKPASQPEEKTGLAPDRNAPVAPQVTGVSATETPSLGGGLVARRVLTDASGVGGVTTADGKYIRGIDWDTGDVVQFEVASGQRSRITNRGPWSKTQMGLYAQAFSRDGKQIAYHSHAHAKDDVCQLRIRNLDGSGLRTLYSEKGFSVYPLDWSPDAGSILALRHSDKAVELTLISTADGSVRTLRSITSGWFMFERASFSPDGRFVAFSFVREGSPPQGDVFLMTADGRNEVIVAGHPAEDQLLGWTPDGRSLVFLSDRSGTWDIWTVHITGGKQQGEPELLEKNFGWDSEVLGFAPDGSLYYKTHTSSGRLYNGAVDLETGKVLVPPAPVTTRYTGPPNFLTWSPDGSNLAYISRRGSAVPGNDNLTIRSTATGEERFLSPRLRGVIHISWAPDGRSIIAGGITGTESGIFRIDTETSAITRLAVWSWDNRLCPDGKTLVFVKEGPIIAKRNLDTGEESEVVKGITGGTGTWHYDLSPDGREVVFQVDGAVKTVSLNGGEPRELFRGFAQEYELRWTRDGRYIIARAGSEIWRVPAQGGTPLKLDLSVPKMASFSFTLHPDNRRFAFSVDEESKSELWVLENFLPAGMGVKDSK